MKIDPENEGSISINSTGVGTVTRQMVRERAVELALIDGRSAQEVSKDDWEIAKRELTGGPDLDARQTLHDDFDQWQEFTSAFRTDSSRTSDYSPLAGTYFHLLFTGDFTGDFLGRLWSRARHYSCR